MSLKLFGKNAVIYAIGNVGLRAASFLLIPLYTHSLSIKDYGLLMTLLITIQFMVIAMNCGMRPALIRFAKEYEKSDSVSELLGTSCFVNLLGGLAVSGISLTFLVPIFRAVLHCDNVYPYMILVSCASLLESLSVHIMSYYRAKNKSVKFMVTGLIAAGILFITSYIFLYVLNLGIRGVLLSKIVTYALIFSFVSFNVFSLTGIRVSFSLVSKLLRFGFPLLFSMSGQLVIPSASVYFLSLLCGLEAVAIFSLGYKLTTILSIIIILPFQLSFQPFVFANMNSPHIKKQMSQLLTYLVLAISGISFCILFFSRFLLPLIAPPEYSGAYLVILMLLPGVSFIGIYYFSETLLNAVHKTQITGLTVTICTILSIILNYMLIPVFGLYGAIIALNVPFMLIGFTLLIIGIKKYPIPIEWRRLKVAVSVLAGVLLLNFVLRTTDNVSYCWISLTAMFAVGVVLCSGIFFDYREKALAKSFLNEIRTRVRA